MTKDQVREIVEKFGKNYDVLLLIRNDETGEAFIDGFGCARCMIDFLVMWATENNIGHIGQEFKKEVLN